MFQFLLVSIMLFACIFVYADNPKINIQGRLTKDFGDPITGKKVKIQIGDLGSGTATENTDSEGLYNVNVSLTDLTFSADTDYTLYVYDSSNNKELAKTSIKFQHVPFSIYSSTATYAIKDSSGNIITDTYVVKNEDITGGTATKITYDSKGLVISSAALDTEDIPELASSKITSLTGYTIAPTAESIVNTDSLNKALGKLQKSIDTKQSATAGTGISLSGGSISLAENYGDTINPYGSKTAKYVLAAPSNENGVPEFRKLTADDLSLTGVSGVSVSGGSIYLLAASNTTSGSIGGIKGDGSTVNIDGSGVISVKKLPTNDSSYFATFSKENESNYVWVMNGSNQGWVKLGSDGQTVTGGADLAEMYASSENLQPGDVVSIDTTKNDAVVKTKVAEDTKVAGVVSTEPGLLLNKNQKGYKLALVGKVPTKVCNEGGNIKRGDLLVSASIAGYAKKAGANPKPGTIIGKALANFSSKKGTILVLVNLQ